MSKKFHSRIGIHTPTSPDDYSEDKSPWNGYRQFARTSAQIEIIVEDDLEPCHTPFNRTATIGI